jgi:kynurenine formamidase
MLIALLAAAAATPAIDETKLVDLTHAFDDKAIYWPTAKPFTWEKESWGRNAQGDWYTAGRYSASEHGGTHVDAPIHFGEGKQTIDRIPVDKFV